MPQVDTNVTEQAFEARALGSALSLKVVDADPSLARDAWLRVTTEFAEVDRALSGYRSDSAVAELNRRASSSDPAPVDRRLYEGVVLAHRAWRRTDGRFDPRVLDALVALGQPGLLASASPDDGRAAQSLAGPAAIPCWLRRVPVTRAIAVDRPVDLHGIGKGLALRWAWREVRRLLGDGAGGILLNAGGDLVGRGLGPDGDPWRIGIENPSGDALPLAVVSLGDGAICTSSIAVQRWDAPGHGTVHHLIDPATGRPGGDGLVAVTVAGPDPAWAEVRTKELFLLGRQGVADRARALGLAAWWVTDEGTLEMTPAGRQRVCWP